MVRFGVSSMFFHEYPLDEIFDFVAEAGFDALEFWPETPDFWLRDQPVPELQEVIAQHREIGAPAVHSPILDLNPCSVNPSVAAISVEYALRALELAWSIGAPVFTVHPGRRTAKRVPSGPDYDRFEHYIGELRRAAAGKNLCVAMENMEPAVNSLLYTPGTVKELMERESWLSFTLDLSHALAVSPQYAREYLEVCHERLVNIHLSRANGGKLHLPVAGDETVAGILSALDDNSYDGFLILEIEDRNFDHDLSSEEKVTILQEELGFITKFIG
ncbi:MAG: sugar phosphate isomerase/epimerase [Methanoregulaceae archaeon]|nr:sugar phosphate isomerase/epimerase [Methanoregulaceae archaeon]